MIRQPKTPSSRFDLPVPSTVRQADDDRVTIVVDTREQEPYAFDPTRVIATRKALPAGDYSIDGCEDSVAVERKTLEDFVSTVIRSRKRFTRELRRLSEYDAACVVVEADLRDILGGRYRSGAHPNAVLGTLLSIVVDFGIPVFFCSDRQAACRFVEGFLHRYHRKVSRRCEQDQTTNP